MMNGKRSLLLRLFGLYLLINLLGTPAILAQTDGAEAIRLIVRVDDMGCSHATNTGIIKTLEDGIATSVEIMAPTPWYPEAVAMLRERPGIDVGIHLTLTSEWRHIKWRPVTPATSLTDEWGYFYSIIWPNERREKGAALLEHDWSIGEVERELRAQIEMVKRDIPWLSHMSAHMGCMNINEETRALYRRLGEEYGLDIFLEDHNVQSLRGVWENTQPAEERTRQLIDKLKTLTPGNWLLVTHPADDFPEQQALGHTGYTNVAHDRYNVMKMLTDKRVREAVEALGIELVSYADLK